MKDFGQNKGMEIALSEDALGETSLGCIWNKLVLSEDVLGETSLGCVWNKELSGGMPLFPIKDSKPSSRGDELILSIPGMMSGKG